MKVLTVPYGEFAYRLDKLLASLLNQEMARRLNKRADYQLWSRYRLQRLAETISTLESPYWWTPIGKVELAELVDLLSECCNREMLVYDLIDAVISTTCPDDCSERRDDRLTLRLISSREIVAAFVSNEDYEEILRNYNIELNTRR